MARAAPVVVGTMLIAASARPAGVFVDRVDEALVSGVRVHRGHEAPLDSERVVEDLDHRNQAVGGARGVRDHDVPLGVEGLVVHTHDEGGICPLRGGGDDHSGGPGVEVCRGLVASGEVSGRLDDDVDPEALPGQCLHLGLRQHLDPVVADDHLGSLHPDREVEAAEDRVPREQSGQRFWGGQVVHCDDLEVELTTTCGSQEGASCPAEAVDSYPHCHQSVPSYSSGRDGSTLFLQHEPGVGGPPGSNVTPHRQVRGQLARWGAPTAGRLWGRPSGAPSRDLRLWGTPRGLSRLEIEGTRVGEPVMKSAVVREFEEPVTTHEPTSRQVQSGCSMADADVQGGQERVDADRSARGAVPMGSTPRS